MVDESAKASAILNATRFSAFIKNLPQVKFKTAIKTGIAGALSLLFGKAFSNLFPESNHLISATWCVLTTFVVLQDHLETTYYTAWIRFLGTLIGSVMGVLFTTLFGSNPLSLGISTTLTILICTILSLNESIRIACFSVAVVLILKSTNPDVSTWLFGVYRFFDASLGILIAVCVARALWPSKVTQKLRMQTAKLLDLLHNLINPFGKLSAPIVQAASLTLEEQVETLKDAKLEFTHDLATTHMWEELHTLLSRTFDSLVILNRFQKIDHIFDRHLYETVQSTLTEIQSNLRILEAMTSNGKNPTKRIDFNPIMETLNHELVRFRETRVTRSYERIEVERFFVFFYSLRKLIEQLKLLEERIFSINK